MCFAGNDYIVHEIIHIIWIRDSGTLKKAAAKYYAGCYYGMEVLDVRRTTNNDGPFDMFTCG